MAEYHFNEPQFKDPEAARTWLEAVRWPNGPICPHCGAVDRMTKLQGESTRPGLYACGHCREQYTVTVGTVFERSKIALDRWLLAAALMACSKKGISSKQVERMLGVTYKTAWFMTMRLREAMKAPGGMFSAGGMVEADETYVGGKERTKHASKRNVKNIGGMGKQMIFTLIDRKAGKARSFHLASVHADNLKPILQAQLNTKKTHLRTDGERQYQKLAPLFKSHEYVNHGAGEYVRGDAHTNSAENYFSILKRGIVGTFHHVSPQHLIRYTTEFDFRYNNRETKIRVRGQPRKWIKGGLNDSERMVALLKGISGKRLMYRCPDEKAETTA